MIKAEFDHAILRKLEKIPLGVRRQWRESDLMVWFFSEQSKDTYLRWEGCKGDIWQHVKGLGINLIGKTTMH